MFKGGDIIREEMLYHIGLKDYEIAYLKLMRQKEISKRHWEKLFL